MARRVVTRQHVGRLRASRQHGLDLVDAGAERGRLPRAPQEAEVERELQLVERGTVVRRDAARIEQIDLADHHALAVASSSAAPAADDVVHLGPILIVDVLLAEVIAHRVRVAVVGRRVVAQRRVLDHLVDHVDAEAVDAPVEPEADDVLHRRGPPSGCHS